MTQPNINQLLAEIVRRQAAQGPLPSYGQSSALAQAVLSPSVQPYSSSPVTKEDIRGPSPVNRILDLLSRPLYSVANPLKESVEEVVESNPESITDILKGLPRTPGAQLGAAREGFTGREKTTGSDILESAGVPSGLGRAGAGLAFDIALDPLTYAGVGLAPRLTTSAARSGQALRAVEEATERASQGIVQDISRRATQRATETKTPFVPDPSTSTPKSTIPIMRQGSQVQDPSRTFMAGTSVAEPDFTRPAIESAPTLPPVAQEIVETTRGIRPGPFGRPVPISATRPLSPAEIAQIRVGLQRGQPIEQLSPRPLTEFEKRTLETAVAQGKNAKQIRAELTGRTETPLTEQLLEEIPTTPREIPTTATVGAADTIATPTPRAQSVQDMIDEISGIGINWRRMAQRQSKAIPPEADRFDIIRHLELQKHATKSPVFKNMINVQIRKLREGVTPANLIDAARTRAPEFPKLTLSASRRSRSEQIARGFAQSNKYDEINHVGQTNLFNRIQNWVNNPKNKIPEKARTSVAYQMLRVAEDSLLQAGKKLTDAEGYSVRLSDVATLAGGARSLTTRLVDDFRSARPVQAVESVKAANEPAMAQQILDPAIQTAANIADSTGYLPPSRTMQVGTDVTRALEEIAKNAGASAKEAGSAKRFMEDFFNPARDSLYDDIMNEARGLVRQSMSGNIDAQLLNRINKKVYDQLGANPKILSGKISQQKVVEAIMVRMATWWNAKDLRPFAREYIDTARNVAAAFERAMTPLVRSTTPSQRTQAWRVAQGRVSAGSPEEQQLAQRFQYMVERILGAQDVSDQRAMAESILTRSGTTMDDINKELPKRLQFIDKKGTSDVGREFDYSNGKWMHSWKEWDASEPAENLYQLTRSMQLATRKNAMLDDAAARWGVPVKGGEFSHQVSAPRLRGFYFPKQIADQLDTVWKRIESDKFHHGGTALQIFDKVQRMWKTGVTIYSPSHHIRNLNGDIFLSALDGVTTVAPYRKSLQVLHAHPGRYKDIENVFNIMDPNLRDAAIKAQPGRVVVTTGAGHRLTAEQVYQAAESQGFMLRAASLEDLVGGESAFGTFGKSFSPLGGRVHQAAAKTSETRDHFVRMAHFIDALGKSKTKNLRDVFEEAGKRVKRFHPDGSDLTGFEQSVLRRIFPFYSWLRKSTPLILEGIAMRPHISLAFPKAMANLQEISGIESQGPSDPFPMDQMFPEWIKEKGVGPIIKPPPGALSSIGRQQNWRGDSPGYVVINPTNPMTDQLKEMGAPRKSLISSLTPGARIPIELLTGRTALDIPLEEVEGGTAGHLLQQVPPVGIGARITGMTRPEEPYHPEQLINWLLTGGLVQGTGPYRSQAQFEIREALQEIAKNRREEMK